jgi:hypothetical protein
MKTFIVSIVLAFNALTPTQEPYEVINEDPLPIEVQIEQVFKENAKIMKRVAFCESSLNHYDQNGKVLRGKVDSRDSGLYQINEFYHLEKSKELGLDIYTPEGNIKYAKYLLDTQGLNPWNASKKCWNK